MVICVDLLVDVAVGVIVDRDLVDSFEEVLLLLSVVVLVESLTVVEVL